MAIERYRLNVLTNYETNFNEVKTWFDENMPDFFDSVVVDTSSMLDTSIGCKLQFKYKNQLINEITTDKGQLGIPTTKFQLISYIANNDKYINNTGNTQSTKLENHAYSGNMYWTNAIYEIIKINNDAVAFSLTNNTNEGFEYRQPGIIIFTKTNKGEIATIRPSNGFVALSSFKYYATSATSGSISDNYLSVTTKNSLNGGNYLYQKYQSENAPITSFVPCCVCNDDDYCPNVFYLPVSQYKVDVNSDSVICTETDSYYYNGFIAVKI